MKKFLIIVYYVKGETFKMSEGVKSYFTGLDNSKASLLSKSKFPVHNYDSEVIIKPNRIKYPEELFEETPKPKELSKKSGSKLPKSDSKQKGGCNLKPNKKETDKDDIKKSTKSVATLQADMKTVKMEGINDGDNNCKRKINRKKTIHTNFLKVVTKRNGVDLNFIVDSAEKAVSLIVITSRMVIKVNIMTK